MVGSSAILNAVAAVAMASPRDEAEVQLGVYLLEMRLEVQLGFITWRRSLRILRGLFDVISAQENYFTKAENEKVMEMKFSVEIDRNPDKGPANEIHGPICYRRKIKKDPKHGRTKEEGMEAYGIIQLTKRLIC
ncbi:hypothetical protein GH714_006398 [Hevea brasiliensis]|uniref:Uncharacterized protein n=1 Tax=Hevea brasiliensis TaxID=3981 RepID=A0A6A6MCB7_HEVBR|nr:hypothetical protein GH714_006398 [Hevea brasiliensis]